MANPGSFDVNTGMEIRTDLNEKDPKENKKNKKLRIGILIAALFLVIAAAVVCLVIFNDPRTVLIRSLKNTFINIDEGENKLLSSLNANEITKSGEYTASIKIEGGYEENDLTVTADAMFEKDRLQVLGDVLFSFVPDIEFEMEFDDERLSVHIPMIKDILFVYDYHEDNDGYISTLTDTEEINSSLEEAYTGLFESDLLSSGNRKKLAEDLMEEIKNTKVTGSEKREYTIDGKDVNCKGYRVEIDEDAAKRIAESIASYDQFKGSDIDDRIDEILDLTGDLEIEFYIYKNALASIRVMSDLPDMELMFEGGDYRCQNMKFIFDDEEVCEIKGSIEDDKEEASLSIFDDEIFSYEYDFSEGDIEYTFAGGYGSTGKIKNDGKTLEISLDYLDMDDAYVGGSIKVKKGSKFTELSGKEFDLGKASEEDINDLVQDMLEIVNGITGNN